MEKSISDSSFCMNESCDKKNGFIEGYCDGYGQAIENVRYNLIEHLKENGSISIDKVNEICNFCSKIDKDYINQEFTF